MSLTGPLVAALSALGGALVALLAAGVRVGALTQRLAVVETRQADGDTKCERERASATEHRSRLALYEHRVQQAEIMANTARMDVVSVERIIEAMRIAQTQLAAEHDATRDLVARVERTMSGLERKIDRLLGLQDTPPHGLPVTRD